MNAFLKVFNNLKDDGWTYFVVGCTVRSIFFIQYIETESKKPHTNMSKELRILFISLSYYYYVLLWYQSKKVISNKYFLTKLFILFFFNLIYIK